jgi:hypothetical protein
MQSAAAAIPVRILIHVALLLVVLSLSVAARAAAPGSAAIAVVLHSESAELTLDALNRALVEELGMPAVPVDSLGSAGARGVLTVTYRPVTKELIVSYSEAVRGTVTRVVPAPERVTDVTALAAVVAGNLIRDQAAELLPASGGTPAATIPVSPTPTPVASTRAPPGSPRASAVPPREEVSSAAPPPVRWRGNAAFFYPLATNANVPELETNFDFNLLYGHIGALNGLELGMVSTVSNSAHGLQASVLANIVGGQVRAGQFSFIFNRGRSVEGMQVALLNRADETMQGVQLGALNLAGSLSRGLQLSALNMAGNFEGVQAGLVNIGKRVRGVQVGLINIADEIDGVPIGLVSVSRSGGVHPLVWGSNTTYANLGVKFATRYTYTMLSGAMHHDGDHALYGGGFTLGGSIPIAKRISSELDFQALHLFGNASCTPAPSGLRANYPRPASAEDSCPRQGVNNEVYYTVPADTPLNSAKARQFDQSLGKLRALLRFEFFAHLSLFVGTGVTGRVTYPVVDEDTEVRFRLLPELFGGIQL